MMIENLCWNISSRGVRWRIILLPSRLNMIPAPTLYDEVNATKGSDDPSFVCGTALILRGSVTVPIQNL